LHGRQVTIIRRCCTESLDGVMVTLPDGTPCVLPAWMLDPVCCAAMTDSEIPRIAVAAIRALRDLLDEQPLFPPAAVEHAEASLSTQGAHHAFNAKSSKEISLGSPRGVASTANRKPRTVPKTAGPIVANRSSGRAARKERRR
jgi:hypothetical protein